ncbi:probable adenylate kinase 7, mitochondrial [Neltuma alba]|uniref:probable adenylate kinase 7, mitochondrial n=1 Tax=Neltuma alba TaxID=207710 RepID=UPI0010A3EBC3|nr:probable adenylate kinase 7, mitochondrial [Prosopis alba]XP_028771411.1 probable adenylate kinase 7, mitochondrial [Prosopis alba]
MADTEGSASERGVQWVMIGEPGSKRHVFAERLSKLLEVPHISMATLLSQELSPRSSLYQQIANALDEGKLVPEEIIFRLLSKRLEEGYLRGETGFILNGIPRTRIQAEILDHIVHIDLVVNFKCSEQNFETKTLRAQAFNPSREYLRLDSKLLRQDPSKYTYTGSSWRENVHDHAEECKLLEEYYREQKKLINIEVAGGPGETWQGLLAALRLQHIDAPTSSQKLTA